MSSLYGDVLFSKTSWGSKEAKATFGVNITKPNIGSEELALDLLVALGTTEDPLGKALLNLTDDVKTVESSGNISGTLEHIHRAFKFTQNAPNVVLTAIYKEVITDNDSVGRAHLRQVIYKTLLNQHRLLAH